MVSANCKVRHDYNVLHVYCAIHKGKKVKSAYESSGYQARAYPSFSSMKLLGVFLLPPVPWMGCKSITGLRPSIKFTGTHLYIEGEVSCLRTQHNVPS